MARWPDKWIVVPHWDKFQHYKDRRPVWIKLYASELEHRPEWLRLTLADQGLLVRVWGLYALADRRLRVADVIRATADQKCDSRVHHAKITRGLTRLSRAGFLEFSASNTLTLTLNLDTRGRGNKGNGRMPPCPLCEVGGGLHAADCPALRLPVEPS